MSRICFRCLLKTYVNLLIILLLVFYAKSHAQITDPIPEPIKKSGIAVTCEKIVQLPNSDGASALLNFISPAGDGSGRLFVNDQRGKFYFVKGTKASVYMDLKDFFPRFIQLSKQSGFTYFVFHPEFASNGLFYTVHSEGKKGSPKPDYPLTKPVINSKGEVISSSHHSVVTEWTADNPSADRFSGTLRELLRIEQPYTDHNMGQIAFNPNAQTGDEDYGLLYIAASDGGSDGYPVSDTDPLDMGQDLSTPLGAILRIDPQGNNGSKGAYGIPRSNPFAQDGDPNTLGEIWAYGVRNSHRMTWDTEGDGIMLISEIGQALIEEINIGLKGSNYGWGDREGTWVIREDNENILFPLPANDADLGFTYPVAQYDHDGGSAAIAGGVIYRGTSIPELSGHFVFADFTSRDKWYHLPVNTLELGKQAKIFELELRQPNDTERKTTFSSLIGQPGGRTDVRLGVDENGEILVLSKQDGWVRRLMPLIPAQTTLMRGDVVFAVNAGGPLYVDASGTRYEADTRFSGGRTATTVALIGSTEDDTLYQSERYGDFSYHVPLINGDYVVTLKFAERYWTDVGRRVFDASIEGQEVVSNLDLVATVGPFVAYDVEVPVNVTDGGLDLAFSSNVDNAKISAIVVHSLFEPTNELTELPIVAVRASADNGNEPDNTLDGDLNTQWAAEGSGQWIEFDLGTVRIIDQVRIAWYRGDKQKAFFELEVSSDGINWTPWLSGESSGTTLALERFSYNAVEARYVRYLGDGNSIDAWNTITEIGIYTSSNADDVSGIIAPGAKVVRVADGFDFTEGPACNTHGDLYFSDTNTSRIHKWSLDGKLTTFRQNSGRANGLYFDRDDNLLACEGGNRRVTSISPTGKVTVLVDRYEGKQLNSPNDLWIAPNGGIYFTDPRYGDQMGLEQDGFHVYYLASGSKSLFRVINNLVKPNGIVGTTDGQKLYVADAGADKTYVYSIQKDGSLTHRKLFVSQRSDGMTLDERGNLYLTDGAVQVYSPFGKRIATFETAEMPSNVTFCGRDYKVLFITARQGLYSLQMNVHGQFELPTPSPPRSLKIMRVSP